MTTPRAGELDAIGDFGGKELGFGIVNPRTEMVETVEDIVGRVQEAKKYIADDKIFLNPDCGFGTFAQRPMNSDEVAFKKLLTISQAAKKLREI